MAYRWYETIHWKDSVESWNWSASESSHPFTCALLAAHNTFGMYQNSCQIHGGSGGNGIITLRCWWLWSSSPIVCLIRHLCCRWLWLFSLIVVGVNFCCCLSLFTTSSPFSSLFHFGRLPSSSFLSQVKTKFSSQNNERTEGLTCIEGGKVHGTR